MRDKAILIVMALAVLIGSGCSRADPEAICGAPETQARFLQLIYDVMLKSNVTASTGGDFQDRVRDRVADLRKSGFLTIDTVSLDQYDPNTRNIECRVSVGYHLTKNQTSPQIQTMAEGIDSTDPTLKLPDGLFTGHADPSIVRIGIRRNAANGERIYEVLEGAEIPAYATITMAAAQMLEQTRFANALADADGPSKPTAEPEGSGGFQYLDPITQIFPKIGTCFSTSIREISSRLEGDPDSGSFVGYVDGHHMVDYTKNLDVNNWRKGDQVRLCVNEVPTDCPARDHRGVGYIATNLRTHTSWDAGDSSHVCGGA